MTSLIKKLYFVKKMNLFLPGTESGSGIQKILESYSILAIDALSINTLMGNCPDKIFQHSIFPILQVVLSQIFVILIKKPF